MEIKFKHNGNKVVLPLEMVERLIKEVDNEYNEMMKIKGTGLYDKETIFNHYNGTKVKQKSIYAHIISGFASITKIEIHPFGVTIHYDNKDYISLSDDNLKITMKKAIKKSFNKF